MSQEIFSVLKKKEEKKMDRVIITHCYGTLAFLTIKMTSAYTNDHSMFDFEGVQPSATAYLMTILLMCYRDVVLRNAWRDVAAMLYNAASRTLWGESKTKNVARKKMRRPKRRSSPASQEIPGEGH